MTAVSKRFLRMEVRTPHDNKTTGSPGSISNKGRRSSSKWLYVVTLQSAFCHRIRQEQMFLSVVAVRVVEAIEKGARFVL